jgi:asparagine synthase (glutamine-hydrolysing)
MSGICGIFRLDGGPPEGIEAMAARLERRGPDGTHIVRDGALALGHTALNTTPESLHETLPFTHRETGCTITADLRLDNRDELIAALGLDAKGRVIGDGEIVLAAYLRWGEDCPTRLLGDFAFAIWDPRKRHLFCARDQMGMKQLIHCHMPGKVFAFASEPRAVLLAENVPRRINEGRIADFLEDYLEGIDFTSTFFEEVFRLPPAHCLTVSADRFDLRRYWTLEPGPELKLASDEDYAQAFLEVFTEAVRSRLRVNGPVGSMLSGGMDSGSVVAVASRLLAAEGRGPLHTFSCLGPDPKTCIETRTAWATINHVPGIEPHVADYTKLEPYIDDLIRLMKEIEEPFDGHMVLPRLAYLMASRTGVRVVMDGVGGDTVLSSDGRLPRLIRTGRWISAWQQAKGEAHFWRGRPQVFLLGGIRQAVVPDVLRRIRRRRRLHNADNTPEGQLLHPDLAEKVNLAARRATFFRHRSAVPLPQAEQRAEAAVHTFPVVGRERYDRVASSLPIEPRDPFTDHKVAEFCLRLPETQVGGKGWHKLVLRLAVAGLLPDTTRWRTGKEHLGADFTRATVLARAGGPTAPFAPRVNLHGISVRPLPLASRHDIENLLADGEDLPLLELSDWLDFVVEDAGAEIGIGGT